MKKGLDVSEGQGLINWEEVLKDSLEWAIIRVGVGSDSIKQDDKQAVRNMDECERLGIPYGVYLYSYAMTLESAKSEAAHMLRMINGRNPRLGVWYDMEDADHYKAQRGFNAYEKRREITDFCLAFCNAINDAGYNVGIYANLDYWRNVLYANELEKWPRWLAQWGPDNPSLECAIWQYTSKGHASGITSQGLDLDYLYKEYDKIFEIEPIKPIQYTRQINGMPIISRGSRGKAVKIWQIICGADPDGVFGPNTENATRAYQKKYGLTVDGIVGPQSWNAGVNTI